MIQRLSVITKLKKKESEFLHKLFCAEVVKGFADLFCCYL